MIVVKPRVPTPLFWIFFVSIFIPTHVSLEVAGFRLTPYRACLLYFLFTNVGYFSTIVSSRGYRAEKLIMLFSFWVLVSLTYNHDLATALESGGIQIVETIGPLLIASAYCATVARLYRTVKMLAIAVAASLLISVPESVTGINWFSVITDAPFGGVHSSIEKRMGFFRARASFDHPILYGVMSASVFGLTYFVMKRKYFFMTILATVSSLSSGALASLIMQTTLIVWNRLLINIPRKWTLYCASILLLYLAAEAYSNRSGFMALLTLVTFSEHTAYWRSIIFEAGLQNVYANPLFGIGFNDWVRPSFMRSGSMDNFWLVVAVRLGVPAFVLYASAIAYIGKSIHSSKHVDLGIDDLRKGWLVGLAGSIVAGGTVHFWNASYVYFNFYLGLGLALHNIYSERISQAAAVRKEMRKLDEDSLDEPGH